MSESPEFVSRLRVYEDAVQALLRRSYAMAPSAESTYAVQVERGMIFPELMIGSSTHRDALVERLIMLSLSGRDREAIVVDRLGHQRSVYHPLLIYAWLMSFKLEYEKLPRETFGRWEESLRIWCDGLEATLQSPLGEELIPASAGAAAARATWTALSLQVAGRLFVRDAWTDLAADTLGRVSRLQQASGAFLAATGSDNPEATWYHEMQILHAAASYAVQVEDRTVAAAVLRATTYHLNETQPDHATSQPWGLFAFIWNARTQPLADQLLHAVRLQEAADGVSLILLADALYCVRLFV